MDRSKWEYKKLGDICDKGSSNIAQNKIEDNTGDYALYGASGYVKGIDFYHQEQPYIGVVKDGSGVGRVNKYPAKSSLLGTMQYIFPKECCDLGYLLYVLQGLHLEKYKTGAAIPHIYFKDYCKCEVPFPSIADQQRIVAELDCLNEMIAVKQEQLKEFDKLAQSIFYDMFGDPLENTHGWCCDILANLVSEDCSISYGIVQPGDDVEDGVPVVRPVDLTSSIVYRKGLKVVDKAISDSYKRTILKGNELLFCVRGTTGIMSFASEELKGCNVTRGITPLSFSEKVDRIYVYYLLATPYLQSIIAEKTNGIALKQINMRDVRLLPILLPPLSLQQQFAEKISAIEAQKELVKQSIAETQHLLDYTMDKYFG